MEHWFTVTMWNVLKPDFAMIVQLLKIINKNKKGGNINIF